MMKNTPVTIVENELKTITNQLLLEAGSPCKREIKLEDSLQRHLGIDSLGRAELFKRIEATFHVTLPDRLLAEVESLKDIVGYLQEAEPVIQTPDPTKIIASHGESLPVDTSAAETLIDILMLYAKQSPNKVHIFFQNENGQEEPITYQQLLNTSLGVAKSLRDKGLKEGETVAIMQPTQPGFFYTFMGILLAGGIPVPIYPPFRMHMLEAYAKTEARILSNAEVRMLITFDKAEVLSRMLQAFVPSLKVVTTVDALLNAQPLTESFHAKATDAAFIQYTSGSTNDPKGVLLTHANLLANIRAYGQAIKVTPNDVGVSWLPLYHDMGLIAAWLGGLCFGVPLILMTPFSFLNHPERWLWAIHYHRATLSGAPNFAYELCINKVDPSQIEGLDLSSWRVAANGAEKVYPRTLDQFAEKFAPYGFKREALMPVYGLAESTVALSIPPLGREFRVDYIDRQKFEEEKQSVPSADKNALAFVSCGMPIPGQQVRIVDEENQTLPERYVGSLQFSGPSNMQGYFNNPKATAAICFDGWLDSGDLAYMAEGEIFIAGRRKDLIIKAGRNIYPPELEEIVGAIPGVRQGCVAAFGHTEGERGTEQLIIVAETREKNKSKRESIIQDINEAVSNALDIVPDQVVLAAPHAVPKTSSGKLQRALCKKMYLEGKLGRLRMPPWMQVAKLSVSWLWRQCVDSVKLVAKYIYTAYMALVLVFTVVPLYLAVLCVSEKTAAKLCRWWAITVVRLSFSSVKRTGVNYLTSESPVIYVANHASFSDAILLLSLLPAGTRFVGKYELFSAPIIGTFMRKLRCLAVDRTDLAKGLEDTKQMEEALRSGDSILIFPEGTFGYASGLRPFRLGAFKIAAEANVAVCPVALKGTRKILRDDEKLIRPGAISLTVCAPIRPAGADWQDVTSLRQLARAEIAVNCGEPSLDYIAAQTVAPKQVKR